MAWAQSGTLLENLLLASFGDPAQQRRFRLALVVVSGVSPSFTARYVGDLPFIGDPVLNMNGRSSVVRTLTIDTPLAALNDDASSALAHLANPGSVSGNRSIAMLPGDPKVLGDSLTAGAYVNVFMGVTNMETGSGSFEIEAQVAQLSVRRVTSDGRTATLELADWAAVLEENPLITTYAPVDGSGNPITRGSAINELINGAFPAGWLSSVVTVSGAITSDSATTKVGLSFDGSRLDAIASLMEPTINGVFNSRTGQFVSTFDLLRVGQAASVIWQFGSRPDYPTTLFDYSSELAENAGYNAIPLSWESADGQSFGTVLLVDNVTTSPTYWNGPYGHRPAPAERIDSVGTEAEAITVATQRLAASTRRNRKVSFRAPIAPIEPNDTVRLAYPYALNPVQTVTEIVVVEEVDLPLTAGFMNVTGYTDSRTVA